MMRRQVTITHPEKPYFPSGFRKVDLIRYYGTIARWMLPHLRDRPVTLIRYPEGVRGEKFYEKNAPAHAPAWIKTFPVPRVHHAGDINYILINNVETLAWCANLGSIEFHPFLHRAPRIGRPTHLAFDLDPGEGADLLTCIEVAALLRAVFGQLGLQAFPKVSGSKGLQLYVPLNVPLTYDSTTPFAKSVAEHLAQHHPQLVVSEMSKALRKKRVLIDWSQNSEAKTTVCVYAVRGKHDEPFVSCPVTWDELDRASRRRDPHALFFSPDQAIARAKKLGDLFAPVLTLKQTLPAAFMRLSRGRSGTSTRRRASRPKVERGLRTRSQGSRSTDRSLKLKTSTGGSSNAGTSTGRKAAPALAAYAAKRDFSKTSEPPPRGARSRLVPKPKTSTDGSGGRFVIQKHEASHLHFDFRLEMHGTLKSWAVPKGLPYELGVKRSAFQTEDHPVGYLDFEGTIPKGQYGGGTVMVWDIGTYEVLGGNYYRGDLKLRLNGRKLKGEWHIFRIKSDDAKPVWLVAKSGEPMKPLSAKQEDQSVLTGRTMRQIESANDATWDSTSAAKVAHDGPIVPGLPRSAQLEAKLPHQGTRQSPRRRAPSAPQSPIPNPESPGRRASRAPSFIEPMKPRLVAALPEGPDWLYEVKWDGFRALLLKHGDAVRLLSRNNKPLDRDFPGIVAAGRELEVQSCLIDGEIVALDAQGRPTFQALQNRATTDATIVFHAFDLLSLDGHDLRDEPLARRKEWLADVVSGTAIRLSRELKGSALAVAAGAERLGLEGIVAKRRDSPYRSGDRSMDWQKVRLRRGQEFVVGGYRPGMHPFESVLVGYYEGKKLMFAGKVRPGFRPHSRRQLWDLIKDDEIDECPFANLPDADRKGRWGEGITPAEMKTLRWVKPRIVVDIGFAEWTANGHLRHAEFRGLRPDKSPKSVRKEIAS